MRQLGFNVQVQNFSYDVEVINTDTITAPGLPGIYSIHQMTGSISAPVGGITAELALVPAAPMRCARLQRPDFAGLDFTGRSPMMRRADCHFSRRRTNAANCRRVSSRSSTTTCPARSAAPSPACPS